MAAGWRPTCKRWIDQFQKADGTSAAKDAKVKKDKIAGLPATAVDVKGTYMGGSMMGPSTPKPGYRLLGAIVEGPGGNVFFKLTGSGEDRDRCGEALPQTARRLEEVAG